MRRNVTRTSAVAGTLPPATSEEDCAALAHASQALASELGASTRGGASPGREGSLLSVLHQGMKDWKSDAHTRHAVAWACGLVRTSGGDVSSIVADARLNACAVARSCACTPPAAVPRFT